MREEVAVDDEQTPVRRPTTTTTLDDDEDDVDSLDIEKLRPSKPLDLLAHQTTTPSRYMMPASQVCFYRNQAISFICHDEDSCSR